VPTIGVFPNTSKQSVGTVLNWIIQYLDERGVKIVLPEEVAHQMGFSHLAGTRECIQSSIDVAVTLGGDGTLLNTTREIAGAGIPICGINMGRLGFLTEVELPELSSKLDKLIGGDYDIEERLMLNAMIKRNSNEFYVSSALNDVVITKGGFSRMIRLKLYIGDILTANYQADGLIVATSTGSTGYSLSAGGPIINPSLKVILITPICPHTLNARSLIIANNEEVRVNMAAAHTDMVLTVDGQIVHPLLPDDEVIVKRAPFDAKFVRFEGKNYYETLRTKLWRGD